MNIWKISIRNIKSKPLYSFLSIFILSLSITLLLGIQQLKKSFEAQIENNLSQIDLVIGAKGSSLQLTLASVLHIDNPTGNIPYKEAKKISENSMIKLAVPISYGDNYKGYRIVGTTNQFISLYKTELEKGRKVKKAMEVILGNTVAKELNLKIGDSFLSSHGLIENNIEVHSDKLTIVGILKPTQKVIDRLIITNLESVWETHDHGNNEHHEEHKHHEEHEDKEITSLLVTFKNPRAFLTIPRKINKHTSMQAALPKYELGKLYKYTNIGLQTISWIGYLILIISCVIIFISSYKMIKERAFDLAILRTYGANNYQLIKMVIYEGGIIVLIAFLLGLLLIKIALGTIVSLIQISNQQIILQELVFKDFLQIASFVFLMVFLSISLAIYPIINMNISTILSNEK
ncbi:putative ABC transport system permease protein [Tenacibaculum sp. MAR_2010_89]|uniref:ABC transporter permease n=1 Tax=Tenacibaculum sp. MAR_2010_89 TaxID=1250198 RepID=UPI000898230D|nr:FtsX-like permease family protein [Tenacibaculum sp. MAR_2010_89]SEE33062.1 putative ABC transport system permease protein [Tenacibaculum sp. MAR_2010_89]